ncbi:MAG TPA: cobalamin-dependent protein [Candidatus Binataceae bacterium]|nr:cobalamin-dependent protein [Candidatus Binataceae bacterium]
MPEEAALQNETPFVEVGRPIPRRDSRVAWHTPGRVVADSPAPCDMVLNCYVDLLMQSDHRRAMEIIEGAVASGIPLAEVYVRILQPALAEIGRRCEANLATAADQRYAATITQRLMARLQAEVPRQARRGRSIVAACVDGDQHDIGILMLSDLIDLDGWDAYCAGACVPTHDLIITLERRKPNVLALSATMLGGLLRVVDVVTEIRKCGALQGLRIMVGGRMFNEDPHLWRKIGADGYARDATDAVLLANWLMSPER